MVSATMGRPSAAPTGDADGYRRAIDAFGEVAAALGEGVTKEVLLHLIARKICEIVEVERCSVYLDDESTGLFRGQVGHASRDIDAEVKRLVCGTDKDGLSCEIIKTQAPVVVENATTDLRPIQSAIRAWGIESILGVPMVLRGKVIGLVYLDSKGPHEFSTTCQATAAAFANLAAVAISQSKLNHELRVGHEELARRNHLLRRVHAVDDRLTALVLRGGDLAEIAQAVSDLTRKYCAVFDADARQCLASGLPEGGDRGLAARLFDLAALRSLEDGTFLCAEASAAHVAGPFPIAGARRRVVVAPVTVGDERWATLVIVDHGVALTAFDILLGNRAATIIALELNAERRAAIAVWNARSSLASELVRGNRDSAALTQRAARLGSDLDRTHVLCLLTTGSGAGNAELPDSRRATEVLERLLGSPVLATGVAEGIAAIVQLPADAIGKAGVERLKPRLREACREFESDGAIVIGVSTTCCGSGGYVRAYEQARQAVQCLEIFAQVGGECVVAADDLGVVRLLLTTSDSSEIRRFAEETLGPLTEQRAGRVLLETLSCFFAQERSVRLSAIALGVHQNTIRNRLTRIEDLTGSAITSDADAQLSAQIALAVFRLEGHLALG